ncbi:MAG: DNA polymerase/3'-5' exonuclease PolX [Candidatus Marinimicrobia bacterium]|nr:DNA polymerase/3'-5' exonuclease PolX [Candidatus Neomarinimicrobiota bacterium]
MESKQLIKTLKEIAALMALAGENQFKVRAFENGARVVESHKAQIESLAKQGRLETLSGIGKGLAEVITELVLTGKSTVHGELRQLIPAGMLDILRLPGMGVKRVQLLATELDITTLGELEYACVENRLANMKGMGQKQQARLLEAIRYRKRFSSHFLLGDALKIADAILYTLRKSDGIQRVELAGSVRRYKEVVRNINFVLTTTLDPQGLAEILTGLPSIDTIASVSGEVINAITDFGIPVRIRLTDNSHFPAVWLYESNSSNHNEYLKQLAREKGYSWRQTGLHRNGKPGPADSEEAIYQKLGLRFIPPELREEGEPDLFPDSLVNQEMIQGFFHCHTTYSDGVHTLDQMVNAARKAGYQYMGLSDHSQSAYYANGLKTDRLEEQWAQTDALNASLTDFHIFRGIESDILPDGRLDYEDDILAQFDFVIASVHNHMGMDRVKQTARIIKALENPYTTMLGHPTGRLLLSREEYALDMDKVIDAAAANGKIIEINCSPQRLDLDWRWIRLARRRGVMLAINPDAHSMEMIDSIPLGVGIARKGGLAAEHVLNTRSTAEVTAYFKP